MIGRGALGNPWIFSGKSHDLIPIEELIKVILAHAKSHIKHYGNEYGLVTFRKHLLFYFKGIPNIKKYKPLLCQITDIKELKKLLNEIKKYYNSL